MLMWSLVFFIIAVIAGILGLAGGLASTALMIAKGLFFLFLVLFVISLVMKFLGKGGSTPL